MHCVILQDSTPSGLPVASSSTRAAVPLQADDPRRAEGPPSSLLKPTLTTPSSGLRPSFPCEPTIPPTTSSSLSVANDAVRQKLWPKQPQIALALYQVRCCV